MENSPNIVPTLDGLFARLEGLKAQKGTLWFGITGSWRTTSDEVEQDVRETVRRILVRGDGIVTGGALNVDYFATDEALILDPGAQQIKVFLPVPFDLYAAHYRKRAEERVITPEQAEYLIAQLETLQKRNPAAVVENVRNTVVDPATYFERNTEVVNASDAVIGFQVNGSEGVEDTVNKALGQEKPVYLRTYTVA